MGMRATSSSYRKRDSDDSSNPTGSRHVPPRAQCRPARGPMLFLILRWTGVGVGPDPSVCVDPPTHWDPLTSETPVTDAKGVVGTVAVGDTFDLSLVRRSDHTGLEMTLVSFEGVVVWCPRIRHV